MKKIRILGGGTYGKVYEAVSNGTTYAIKKNFVSPVIEDSIGSIRELDILQTVRGHPFCVQLVDAKFGSPFTSGSITPDSKDFIPDKLYFILEKGHINGDDFIRNQQYKPISDRKRFALHVLLATEFLHSRKIFHRDIKPANIICTCESGRFITARLADFGLSQHYTDKQMNQHGFVTLWYRAPEICLLKQYNLMVDVWSIGCIFYELFSVGNRRFVEGSTEEACVNKMFEKIPFSQSDIERYLSIFSEKTRSNNPTSIRQWLMNSESYIQQFNTSSIPGNYDHFVNLLENMLTSDPKRRWSITKCINHPFFDGQRDLINETRSEFGINTDGVWILEPTPTLRYRSGSPARKLGLQWFLKIYECRDQLPIRNWYTPQIFFHALEMFDRYIEISSIDTATNIDVIVWVDAFLFMTSKYFRILVREFGVDMFAIGIMNEDIGVFKKRVYAFEEKIVREVFKFEIFHPTIWEVSSDYLTSDDINSIVRLLLTGSEYIFPPKTSLFSICATYRQRISTVYLNGSSPAGGLIETSNSGGTPTYIGVLPGSLVNSTEILRPSINITQAF